MATLALSGRWGELPRLVQILVTVISTVDVTEALPEVHTVVSFAVNETPLNAE